jgi:hypothetical protein
MLHKNGTIKEKMLCWVALELSGLKKVFNQMTNLSQQPPSEVQPRRFL